MFNLDNIKVLHVEPTTVCNASCPQCHREDPRFYVHDRDKCEIELEQIKQLFEKKFIEQLEKMFMCGNFGEPAAARDTLEIYKYFRSYNNNITLGMNTNGSVRNTHWWKSLAETFNQPFDYVVFSIDGLEDTNPVYRKNTSWNKILENAQSFISNGGSAHWDMLVYEHNEHQVDACERLARELGFTWFRAKVSKRFYESPVEFLNPPKGYHLPNVTTTKNGPISCHALNEKSVYLAANGRLLPCCWFGAETFTLDLEAEHLLSDWNLLVNSWNQTPHRICNNTCTPDPDGTSFSKQWKIEKQLR